MPDYPALCSSPICHGITLHGAPSPTGNRAHLCHWCTDRLRRQLHDIHDLWAAVEANLGHGGTPAITDDKDTDRKHRRSHPAALAVPEQVGPRAGQPFPRSLAWLG